MGMGLQAAYGAQSVREALKERLLAQIAEQERQRKGGLEERRMKLDEGEFKQRGDLLAQQQAERKAKLDADIAARREDDAAKAAPQIGMGQNISPEAYDASFKGTGSESLFAPQVSLSARPTMGVTDLNREQVSSPAAPLPQMKTGRLVMTGTAKQQDEARQNETVNRLISRLPPDSRERMALEYEQGTGKNPPAGVFDPQPSKTLYQVGPTGRYVSAEDAVGKDAYHPPQAPSAVVVQGPNGPELVNKRTGQASPVTSSASGDPMGQAPTQQQRNQKAQYAKARPILGAISELSEKINIGQGLAAKASGAIEQQKAKINLNDDVAEYEAMISGFTPLIARALGHTGVLTEQDVQSVKALFPRPGDSKSLRDRKVARIEQLMGAIEGGPDAGGASQETKGGGTVRARDPQGRLHEAPAGTALPSGWKIEK